MVNKGATTNPWNSYENIIGTRAPVILIFKIKI